MSVEPQELGTGRRYFHGYEPLQKEEQLLDLAGVGYGTFDFLLEKTLVPSDSCKFIQKNSNPEIIIIVNRYTENNYELTTLQSSCKHITYITLHDRVYLSKITIFHCYTHCL